MHVADQTSRKTHTSYKRPDIHSVSEVHWTGGHIHIKGRNFGTISHHVSVYIGDEECKHAKIIKHHEKIRCTAPVGDPAKKYDVKVRVDGLSSSKSGHSWSGHLYKNEVPTFVAHTNEYVAVLGETLKIKLEARDKDGDNTMFRLRGKVDGVSWKNAHNAMVKEE